MIFFFAARASPTKASTRPTPADLLEGLHHRLVRATVERPLEGGESGGDGPVDVGQGGGGHPGREGGGVELVVGVEHQGHVHGCAPPSRWVARP